MALKNPNLVKLGGTLVNDGSGKDQNQAGVASGHTQMTLVKPAVALPDPGPRNLSDPTWPRRYQQYLESIQISEKFSGDNE